MADRMREKVEAKQEAARLKRLRNVKSNLNVKAKKDGYQKRSQKPFILPDMEFTNNRHNDSTMNPRHQRNKSFMDMGSKKKEDLNKVIYKPDETNMRMNSTNYPPSDTGFLSGSNKSTVRAKHSSNTQSGNIEKFLPKSTNQILNKSSINDAFDNKMLQLYDQGGDGGLDCPSLSALDMFENMTPMVGTLQSKEQNKQQNYTRKGQNESSQLTSNRNHNPGRGGIRRRSQSDEEEVAALAEAMELNKQLRAAMKPNQQQLSQPPQQEQSHFQQQLQEQFYNNKERYMNEPVKSKAGMQGIRQMSREKRTRSESAPNPTVSAKLIAAEAGEDDYKEEEEDYQNVDHSPLKTKDANELSPLKQKRRQQQGPPLNAVKAWRVVESSPVRHRSQTKQNNIHIKQENQNIQKPKQVKREQETRSSNNRYRSNRSNANANIDNTNERRGVAVKNSDRELKTVSEHNMRTTTVSLVPRREGINKTKKDSSLEVKRNIHQQNDDKPMKETSTSPNQHVKAAEQDSKISPIKRPSELEDGGPRRGNSALSKTKHSMHKQKGVTALRAELDDALKMLEDVESNPIGKSIHPQKQEQEDEDALLSSLRRSHCGAPVQIHQSKSENDVKSRDAYHQWWRKMQGVNLKDKMTRVAVEEETMQQIEIDDYDSGIRNGADAQETFQERLPVSSIESEAVVKVQSVTRQWNARNKVEILRQNQHTSNEEEARMNLEKIKQEELDQHRENEIRLQYEQEEIAAIKIQSVSRQNEAKQMVRLKRKEAFTRQQEETAAKKIQSLSRRHEAKQMVRLKRKEAFTRQQEETAAKKIQSLSRQHKARKTVVKLRLEHTENHDDNDDHYSDDNFEESEADTFLTSFNSLKVKELKISPISSPRCPKLYPKSLDIGNEIIDDDDDVIEAEEPAKIPTKLRPRGISSSSQPLYSKHDSLSPSGMSPLARVDGVSEKSWSSTKTTSMQPKQMRVGKGELKLKRRNDLDG